MFLDRLRHLVEEARDPMVGLEEEIKEEMANALGRSGIRADVAFAKLQAKAEEIVEDIKCGGLNVVKLLEEFQQGRVDAKQAVEGLILQRESVGLRRGNRKLVDHLYHIPPELPHDSKPKKTEILLRKWLRDMRDSSRFSQGSGYLDVGMANATSPGLSSDSLTKFKSEMQDYLESHNLLDWFPTLYAELCSERPVQPVVFASTYATKRLKNLNSIAVKKNIMEDSDKDTLPLPAWRIFFSGFTEHALLHLHQHRPEKPLEYLSELLHAQRQLFERERSVTSSLVSEEPRLKDNRVVQVWVKHGETTYKRPHGTILTEGGRIEKYGFGLALSNYFVEEQKLRPKNVSARSLRGVDCIHSTESLLHGIFEVMPMPTELTRERMPLAYTEGHCSLVYRCNIGHHHYFKTNERRAKLNSDSSGKTAHSSLLDWASVTDDNVVSNNGDRNSGTQPLEKSAHGNDSVPIVAARRPADEDIQFDRGKFHLRKMLTRIASVEAADRGRSPIYRSKGTNIIARSSNPAKLLIPTSEMGTNLEAWYEVDLSDISESYHPSLGILVPEENPSASLAVHVCTERGLSEFAKLLSKIDLTNVRIAGVVVEYCNVITDFQGGCDLHKQKKDDLKRFLKKRGAKVGGKKADLIQRVEKEMKQQQIIVRIIPEPEKHSPEARSSEWYRKYYLAMLNESKLNCSRLDLCEIQKLL
eukprot:g6377.t1